MVQERTDKEELPVERGLWNDKPELKVLPPNLKYSFLEGDEMKPVIISSSLTAIEEKRVIGVLKANQGAIRWKLSDLKGISPAYCMHRIHMESNFKPVA